MNSRELEVYLRPIFRWWWLIVLAAILAAGSAFVFTRLRPPVYIASGTVMIGTALQERNPDSQQLSLTQGLALSYARIAQRHAFRGQHLALEGPEFLVLEIGDRIAAIDRRTQQRVIVLRRRRCDDDQSGDVHEPALERLRVLRGRRAPDADRQPRHQRHPALAAEHVAVLRRLVDDFVDRAQREVGDEHPDHRPKPGQRPAPRGAQDGRLGARGAEEGRPGNRLRVQGGAAALARRPDSTAVHVVPWTRNERAATAGLKTTSYADNVIALAAAHRAGASEALFANTRGELAEGTGSNVFVVIDGVALTPPLASGALAGVTRGLVVEWAAAAGLPIREADLPMSVLAEADEVFLTSSTRDVQAVQCLLYTSPSPRDRTRSRMPSSA